MTLTLVVGQASLDQSPERATGVVTVQRILNVGKPLLTTAFLLIFAALLIGLCLLVEKLCTVFDGDAPGVMLLGLLPPGLRQVGQPEVIGHDIIPPALLTPNRTLATNRGRDK